MSIKRKKIVYILPEYHEKGGTHFYYNIEFIKKIAEQNDVALIVEKGELPRGIVDARVLQFRILPLRVLELGLVLLRLRFHGYRIFWTHYSFSGGILAPFFGKSFYWNCGMPWLYQRSHFEEWIFQLVLKRSILVTGTEGMKRMYSEQYALDPKRIVVLPNWVDHERFTVWRGKKLEARSVLGLPYDKKIVLFLHHLSRRKGAHLITLIAEALESDHNTVVLVGGSGPLAQDIKGSNIIYRGEIPQEQVPAYYAAADIFLMPSEEEGFPHVVLEAMAAGLPIIATDVGGVREIVPREFQEFIIDSNVDAFASALLRLLNNIELQRALGERARIWVSQYSRDTVFHTFTTVITAAR